MSGPDATIHASCVIVGEAGVLIRGESGSGKSTLARELLDGAAASGLFARLLRDDRVALSRRHGRIIARAVSPIAGRIEIRGLGIVAQPWEPAGVVRLVVDCGVVLPRLPDAEGLQTDLFGVTLPRMAVETGRDSAGFVLTRLRALRDTLVTGC